MYMTQSSRRYSSPCSVPLTVAAITRGDADRVVGDHGGGARLLAKKKAIVSKLVAISENSRAWVCYAPTKLAR